ncbi:hypothetical protein Ctob_016260 [Chrysochromulina tobinii]|uniref:Uncharacterized protein n=1 Tax=Chrysochromulina tobinii TaxID=1460289 RepID=A0A0M0JX23_9EUKA|nr:hypothetical protein Ctob_016260 [Chrysochromulina tobinii]|eukprot:KOO31104.1 hypothetical protein Ctob_016260 [Chrysochromulina sp. CCMP291]
MHSLELEKLAEQAPELRFVVEKVLGQGTVPGSNWGQRLCELVLHMWDVVFDVLDGAYTAAQRRDSAELDSWFSRHAEAPAFFRNVIRGREEVQHLRCSRANRRERSTLRTVEQARLRFDSGRHRVQVAPTRRTPRGELQASPARHASGQRRLLYSLLYSLPNLSTRDPIFDGAVRDEIDESRRASRPTGRAPRR